VCPSAPVRVDYELTLDGERLKPVVTVKKEFGMWLKQKASTSRQAANGALLSLKSQALRRF